MTAVTATGAVVVRTRAVLSSVLRRMIDDFGKFETVSSDLFRDLRDEAGRLERGQHATLLVLAVVAPDEHVLDVVTLHRVVVLDLGDVRDAPRAITKARRLHDHVDGG